MICNQQEEEIEKGCEEEREGSPLPISLGVCTVRSARFFPKFITEPIGIGFLIIKTDAYRLGSVFRPIAVRFFAVGLIGLVGLNIKNSIYFFINK